MDTMTAVETVKITIITKEDCTFCEQTRQFLDTRGIDHEILRADLDEEVFDFVVNTIGVREMPVVLLHDGDWRKVRPIKELAHHEQPHYWTGMRRDRLYGLPKQLAELAA